MKIVNLENQRKPPIKIEKGANTGSSAQSFNNSKGSKTTFQDISHKFQNIPSIEIRKAGLSLLDSSIDSHNVDCRERQNNNNNESFSSRETWIKNEQIKYRGERLRISTSTDLFQFVKMQFQKTFFPASETYKVKILDRIK